MAISAPHWNTTSPAIWNTPVVSTSASDSQPKGLGGSDQTQWRGLGPPAVFLAALAGMCKDVHFAGLNEGSVFSPRPPPTLHPASAACEAGRHRRHSHSLSLLSEAETLIRCSTLQSSVFFFFFKPHRCGNELAVSLDRAEQSRGGRQATLLHHPDGRNLTGCDIHPKLL